MAPGRALPGLRAKLQRALRIEGNTSWHGEKRSAGAARWSGMASLRVPKGGAGNSDDKGHHFSFFL